MTDSKKTQSPGVTAEQHPLTPFYPANARILFLGSFPPKRQRWSMDFFYPNYQNDMWRIFGLVFFDDRNHFVDEVAGTFRKESIIEFLISSRIAMYDMAEEVIRHRDNASDKDLEIVRPLDIAGVIARLPDLSAIVATGQKAAETLAEQLCAAGTETVCPKVGSHIPFSIHGRNMRIYRMPSSSRAYPLSLERKAAIYGDMFSEIGIKG
ncbi:MAG: uracil-DNA glycosylase family protein [Prevotellaceae bacterium]|jgi:G:T/U-mismatch repair DNA glycosylase|nr:uracil-DNA glycosylase family protein [Prevotellaceae bacterium]